MATLREDVEEKLKIRQFARENMDENSEEKNAASRGVHNLHAEFSRLQINISQTQNFAVQTDYWDLRSNRKVIGPIIVFIKRCIRKFLYIVLGWYIQGILDRQTNYNQHNLAVLRRMEDIMIKQRNEIMELEKVCQNQSQELIKQKELNQELEELIHAQQEEYLTMFCYYDKYKDKDEIL